MIGSTISHYRVLERLDHALRSRIEPAWDTMRNDARFARLVATR